MFSYYTVIIFLSIFSMGTMLACVVTSSTLSLGSVSFDPEVNSIQDALAASDHMMYENKRAHRALDTEH